jgi:hypothetical protein
MNLFLDCEFNGWHDQGTGELISLGLVSADGKYEFYEAVGCKIQVLLFYNMSCQF